jgi:hypothetical protein
MELLEAFSIANLGIKLQREGDLLYHEGSLLSHFVNEENENEHYFYKWSDCDSTLNRWLIFRVSYMELYRFFQKKINLLSIINENSFVYFIDFDSSINQKNLFLCPVDKIPTDYLPTENSFFQEEQYTDYALKLKEKFENVTLVSARFSSESSMSQEILRLNKAQSEQKIILDSILIQLETMKPQLSR